MTPIVVRATLRGAVMSRHPVGFDALLMSAVALRDNLPPLGFGEAAVIQIPIAEERGIYLASTGICEAELYERRFLNRKFPMLEAQWLGAPKMRAINIKGGPSKSYRIPSEMAHMKDDQITFYAIGDAHAVRELLPLIGYIGKKRSVGLGKVERWDVETCEPWPGFPVLRDGRPLRPLPLDWPGLGEHRVEHRVLSPPYWERWREEPCAVMA